MDEMLVYYFPEEKITEIYQPPYPGAEYTTEEILKLTEGSLLPISCTAPHENPCPRAAGCATLPFWRGLQQVIENYLRRVTLEDLAEQQKEIGCDYGAGI